MRTPKWLDAILAVAFIAMVIATVYATTGSEIFTGDLQTYGWFHAGNTAAPNTTPAAGGGYFEDVLEVNGQARLDGQVLAGDANADTFISSGPVSVNAGTPAGGTLVVASTANTPTTGAFYIASFQDVTRSTYVVITGSGSVILRNRSMIQFDVTIPNYLGETYFCVDCTVKNICVSTGTGRSQFMRADLATAGCGSGN